MPVRRRSKVAPTFEGHGHAEARERSTQREPDRVDGRTDDRDLGRRRAAADEVERLLRDQLERAARPRSLQEPDRAVERRAHGAASNRARST